MSCNATVAHGHTAAMLKGYTVQPRYLGCRELDFWVVLNLPQSFVEAFPLVGLGVLLFVGLIWKDIFRAKKCTV